LLIGSNIIYSSYNSGNDAFNNKEFLSSLFDFISSVIIVYGAWAVTVEIDSRKQERAMRKYDTFLSVRKHILNSELLDNKNAFIDLINNPMDKEKLEEASNTLYTCLANLNIIQKLIENRILDFEDVFLVRSKFLLELYDAVTQFAKSGKREMDEIGKFLGLPLAITLLNNVKEFEEFHLANMDRME
jgi:hypothetical protein